MPTCIAASVNRERNRVEGSKTVRKFIDLIIQHKWVLFSNASINDGLMTVFLKFQFFFRRTQMDSSESAPYPSNVFGGLSAWVTWFSLKITISWLESWLEYLDMQNIFKLCNNNNNKKGVRCSYYVVFNLLISIWRPAWTFGTHFGAFYLMSMQITVHQI